MVDVLCSVVARKLVVAMEMVAVPEVGGFDWVSGGCNMSSSSLLCLDSCGMMFGDV